MQPVEAILRRTTPIIINSFNQLTYLRRLIDSLLENHFRNIYILDNASTFPPLLEYYENARSRGVFVLYYNSNQGPRAFHSKKIYRTHFKDIPHIYTDPDILFDTFADNHLTRLFEISEKYRFHKVGSAIEIPSDELISDRPLYQKELNKRLSIRENEIRFWQNEIEHETYLADIDTTWHLFNPKFYLDGTNFFRALRLSGTGFTLKHLPYYKANHVPTEEIAFYKSHDAGWSTVFYEDNPTTKE